MKESNYRALLVGSEWSQREVVCRHLRASGFVVDSTPSRQQAVEKLELRNYELLVAGIDLVGTDGLAFLSQVRQRNKELSVIVIVSPEGVDSVIEALHIGANDIVLEPLIPKELKTRELLAHGKRRRESIVFRQGMAKQNSEREVVAEAPAMKEVMQWARQAAAVNVPVLLTGEAGTGKETIARAIHCMGNHGEEPFKVVNIAAIPEHRLENELFGYQPVVSAGGERREGALLAAGNGSVFLENVASMSPAAQAKLSEVLDTERVVPGGGGDAIPFRARIMAATDRSLERLSAEETFRKELYYRLKVVLLSLPPLRDRREDIPALANHFLRQHSTRVGLPVPYVTPMAMEALWRHTWKGNVRELSIVLERALILAGYGPIELEHLPPDLAEGIEGQIQYPKVAQDCKRVKISRSLRVTGPS